MLFDERVTDMGRENLLRALYHNAIKMKVHALKTVVRTVFVRKGHGLPNPPAYFLENKKALRLKCFSGGSGWKSQKRENRYSLSIIVRTNRKSTP